MKKLINDPNDVVAEALLGIEAARPRCASTTPTALSIAATHRSRARSGWCRAAVLAMNRCTAGTWGWACLTRHVPGRSSLSYA